VLNTSHVLPRSSVFYLSRSMCGCAFSTCISLSECLFLKSYINVTFEYNVSTLIHPLQLHQCFLQRYDISKRDCIVSRIQSLQCFSSVNVNCYLRIHNNLTLQGLRVFSSYYIDAQLLNRTDISKRRLSFFVLSLRSGTVFTKKQFIADLIISIYLSMTLQPLETLAAFSVS
jgi:hypothetical protein